MFAELSGAWLSSKWRPRRGDRAFSSYEVHEATVRRRLG
jgi:hypothetical protein